MANGDSDFTDLLDDILDGIDDLFPGDSTDPLIRCARIVGPRGTRTLEEYEAAIKACTGGTLPRIGDGNRVVEDIQSDIRGFLDTLLTGAAGGLDDMLDVLGGKLRDAIGGIGVAGERTVGNIGDIAGAILGQVGTSSQGVFDVLGLSVGGAIDTVGGVLGDITAGVGESIEDFLRSIREAIESAITAMTRAISEGLRAAISTVTRVVEGIIERIEGVVTQAIEGITNLLGRVVDTVQDLINRAIERISDVAEKVFQAVATVVEDIRDTLVAAFNNVVEFIGTQIEAATEFIREATDNIVAIGAQILTNAQEVSDAIVQNVNDAIGALTDTASGALSAVREGLDNLQGAVTSALEGIGPVLSEFVVEPTTAATRSLVESITGAIDQKVITLQEGLEQMFTCMGLPPEAGAKARQVINCIFPSEVLFGPVLQNVLVLVTQVIIASSWANQLGQAAGIKALQDIQPAFPIALPDPAMVQEMLRIGTVTVDTANDLLIKNGFSSDDARRILDIRRRIPDVGIVQVWFLRGFITREQALQILGQLGFEEPDNSRLLEMAFFIPPVADLITMAVREVFTPDVAERFGQFQDFPAEFSRFAAQQGISEEWARNYWAAHWALPSVQMGFEMLHRRVITTEDLNLLLRSQDVMPFWREKLTQISFTPLTRVDIRRMHKLGVVTNDEVRDAYRDIGYDEQNAERLLQFTIQLNAPDEGDTPQVLEGLTRAAIISLFRRGTITRSETGELLRAIGLGAAAAETFIQVAELQEDEAQRDAETDLIIEQARAGILTRAQAEDRLNALGVSAVETDRALLKLQRSLDAAAKLPSKSDLDSLLQAEIIGDAVYLDTMTRLGFSSVWATRFLQLARQPRLA